MYLHTYLAAPPPFKSDVLQQRRWAYYVVWYCHLPVFYFPARLHTDNPGQVRSRRERERGRKKERKKEGENRCREGIRRREKTVSGRVPNTRYNGYCMSCHPVSFLSFPRLLFSGSNLLAVWLAPQSLPDRPNRPSLTFHHSPLISHLSPTSWRVVGE